MELFAGHLAVLPLFRGLTPLQLAAIARRAERVAYHPGATIIEENAVAEAAILIVAGTAMRVSGPELATRFEPIGVGALLGETAMLVETTYASTVVARSAVRAVHITRDVLHEQMLEDPDLAAQFAHNLGARLRKVADVLRRADALLETKEQATDRAAETAPLKLAG
ncbi:MAG: cyclic nucleotide-binding domain-containing protein [Hyphomicrobium sp.]